MAAGSVGASEMKSKARRSVLALIALGIVGMLSSPAGAQFDPTGPAKLLLLAEIAKRLHSVYQFLHEVNDATRQMRDRLDSMFPDETLNEIKAVFRDVRSIEEEIQGLSCSWRFSPRVDALRQGLLRTGPLCRDQYTLAFGPPLIGPDADLEEFRQWQGTLRWNVVADTMQASPAWRAEAETLAQEARHAGNAHDPSSPFSVGYSQRLLAVSEALRLQLDARQNAQEAARLAGLQEDLDRERREDWLQKNIALRSLEALRELPQITRPSLGQSLTESLGGSQS